MTLNPELPKVLESDEGAVGEYFQFAKLDAELRQLGQGPELVGVHHRLVEVDIRALHPQHVRVVNLKIATD